MFSHLTIDKNFIHESLSTQPIIKGVVTISHGMAEHMQRYDWLIKHFNKSGYHVISADHIGHGSFIEKGGLPGYFGEGDDLINVESNLIEVLNYANAKFPDLKKILFSHSMGSWIALGVVQEYKNIDLLVLSGSSLIPNKVILSQRKLVSILIAIFGGKAYSKLLDRITIRKNNSFFSPNRTPNDWLSRDVLSVDEYTADDKCGFLVTNSLWLQLSNQFLKVFKRSNYSESSPSLPIYIISGSEDPVGNRGKGV
ncbi:MAG: alpha/beta hydrolase, partial [SAR86 cluster bacterium]|nr:alpha/beta hydrolase [SAR86 cluster bacterium]